MNYNTQIQPYVSTTTFSSIIEIPSKSNIAPDFHESISHNLPKQSDSYSSYSYGSPTGHVLGQVSPYQNIHHDSYGNPTTPHYPKSYHDQHTHHHIPHHHPHQKVTYEKPKPIFYQPTIQTVITEIQSNSSTIKSTKHVFNEPDTSPKHKYPPKPTLSYTPPNHEKQEKHELYIPPKLTYKESEPHDKLHHKIQHNPKEHLSTLNLVNNLTQQVPHSPEVNIKIDVNNPYNPTISTIESTTTSTLSTSSDSDTITAIIEARSNSSNTPKTEPNQAQVTEEYDHAQVIKHDEQTQAIEHHNHAQVTEEHDHAQVIKHDEQTQEIEHHNHAQVTELHDLDKHHGSSSVYAPSKSPFYGSNTPSHGSQKSKFFNFIKSSSNSNNFENQLSCSYSIVKFFMYSIIHTSYLKVLKK